MSTLEEFEAALVGATATLAWKRAVKTFYGSVERNWLSRDGECLSARELAEGNWTLDPAPAAPTTAREALDLAWNLAYPVKEGQTIPANTATILISDASLYMTSECWDRVVEPGHVGILRTLEPLPEPTPDWLDAPAVLASVDTCPSRTVRVPDGEHTWRCVCSPHCPDSHYWSELRDVTPLYPKGQEA